ncbi:MAG TPA: Smr/MutS family protein [Rhizomicrobium sp.]|jgi:DNA-nicking Smr family endonuclease
MSRRKTTKEEHELFVQAIAEARPLARMPTTPVASGKSHTGAAPSGSGLDGRTEERLRRGLISPDARLDLHGFTERDAHHALLLFLRSAQTRRHRLVLVVTGKGARVAPDAPFDMELNYRSRGVLKAVVPRWLREPSFAAIVAGVRSAHVRHGGEGALYIYLRKPG